MHGSTNGLEYFEILYISLDMLLSPQTDIKRWETELGVQRNLNESVRSRTRKDKNNKCCAKLAIGQSLLIYGTVGWSALYTDSILTFRN